MYSKRTINLAGVPMTFDGQMCLVHPVVSLKQVEEICRREAMERWAECYQDYHEAR